jgi:hypothetical protein
MLLEGCDQDGQTVPLGRLDRPRRSDRPSWEVEPAWVAALPRRVFDLGFVAQSSNQVVCGEPLQNPHTWCNILQSPLITRLPRCPGSTFVLRLNQETIHDFVLLFLPPCDPHLIALATGSLEPSLLVCSTPGGLTNIDISRLFFTCTSTNQAASCTYNT